MRRPDSPQDSGARRTACQEFEKNLVVTAGAGTGKTSLLVERMLHLILERGLRLDTMAAITFTRKAAAELRDRLEDALERAFEIASGAVEAIDTRFEADRVIERMSFEPKRMPEGARNSILSKCRDALEALDAASIGTIHSFAADLIRRHSREAGVDVGFEVDEGARARELFDELWGPYLEKSLGSEGAPPGWRGLLEKLPVDDVEEIAKGLAAFSIPAEALDASTEDAQRDCARTLARGCLAELRSIGEAIEGAAGLNRNMEKTLGKLESAWRRVAEDGAFKGDLKALGIPGAIDFGKACLIQGKKGLEKRLQSTRDALEDLQKADPELARDACLALRPFAISYREEYLRRGFVSYDGLLILARDLLRDHPHVRAEEARRHDHILVDEFQDTDPVQYEIIFFLAEEAGTGGKRAEPARDAFEARLAPGKLFIVGDGMQSIYHFRRADIRAYARAVDVIRREEGKVLNLTTNFRSVPEVLDPVNRLFEAELSSREERGALDAEFQPLSVHRKPAGEASVEIWSVGEVGLTAPERRRQEAEAIVSWIRTETDAGRRRKRDVAILLYSLSDVDIFLRALRRLGVPYVVEGGRGFYARPEVENLLALLGVMVNPADPIPLVSCLRSPVCAVPDRELQLYAARPAERGTAWTLDAAPNPRSFPNLARALALLRDFRARHRDEPIDQMAFAFLDEMPLRLAMAASYEGAQRVANLEKVVRRMAELAWDGRMTASEVLAQIEEEGGTEADERDSPLSDETLDAVRVLSIHSAKGLEWPVVFLPDLARKLDPGRGEGTVNLVLDPAVKPALAIRVGDVRTPASLLHHRDEALHREAEAKRLLYVAMTRARDRLILVAGAPKEGDATWIGFLRHWGYDVGAKFPDAETFCDRAVIHRRKPAGAAARPERAGEEPDRALLDAASRFPKAALEGRPIRSPSGLRSERIERDGSAEVLRAEEGPERKVAMAVGTAIHLLLEVWDRRDPSWLFENAPQAGRVAALENEADEAAVRRGAEALLNEMKDSGKLRSLQAEKALGREVPMLLAGEDGTVWDGTMDLIAGAPERPEVVDYKTDAGEDLEKIYEGQLAVYAECLRRAAGLRVTPPARTEKLARRGK